MLRKKKTPKAQERKQRKAILEKSKGGKNPLLFSLKEGRKGSLTTSFTAGQGMGQAGKELQRESPNPSHEKLGPEALSDPIYLQDLLRQHSLRGQKQPTASQGKGKCSERNSFETVAPGLGRNWA